MKNIRKSIVIVGGAGLIGRTFVQACINENISVIVMDIVNEKIWQQLNIGCDLYIQTDINNSTSLTGAIKRVSAQFKVDCVVNASYPRNKNYGKSVFDVSLKNFNENINLHLGGYFHVMQKFAELFIEQGYGNIINIASIQGVSSPKFKHYENTDMTSPIEYTAAKSAIISMSRYMAKYLKGKNIRVNCVSPGGILNAQPQSFLENYRASCLNKGMLNPGDIAGTVKFLVSDESKFINGQNIIVDDGWSL
jgi:NAD(P)-dependent dehydrogenase (short-subunit alcohol dehydrogenase family)